MSRILVIVVLFNDLNANQSSKQKKLLSLLSTISTRKVFFREAKYVFESLLVRSTESYEVSKQ